MDITRKRLFILHPFLGAFFPIWAIYTFNADKLTPAHVLAPLSAAVVSTAVIWAVLAFVTRDVGKGAVFTTVFLVQFFSYGAWEAGLLWLLDSAPWVESLAVVGLVLAVVFCAGWILWKSPRRLVTAIVLAVVLLILQPFIYAGLDRVVSALATRSRGLIVFFHGLPFLIVYVWLAGRRGGFAGWNRGFNVVAVCVVAVSLFQGLVSAEWFASEESHVLPPDGPSGSGELPQQRPNIYYIVLDGYGRHDVLQELYDFDNSAFLERLREMGFYIAEDSRTNYGQTYLSLSSSLNFLDLTELSEEFPADSSDFRRLRQMLQDNAVAAFLKERGYVFVSFATGLDGTEFLEADYYLAPKFTLNEFQNVILRTTPLAVVLAYLPTRSLYDVHRDRVSFALDRIASLGDLPSPKFVLAHIVAPHPPFVFSEKGEAIRPRAPASLADGSHFMDLPEYTATDYVEGYRRQAAYISQRVGEAIAALIEREPDAVIIVQGDHGPGSQLQWEDAEKTNMRERMTILNAYRLPGADDAPLHASITPVNTFRVVLNAYFGTELPMAADRSFFSTYSRPFDWVDVTEELDGYHAP